MCKSHVHLVELKPLYLALTILASAGPSRAEPSQGAARRELERGILETSIESCDM